ncbi:DNA-binding transcriptional regulator, MarR family [Rhizobium sp. RU33A]|uniref:MarR family winged helix-turn-helix transcriptional regulator n=1 Tax=Rhizobium sp. RU33A TaxID=1907413 RepID=UPI000953BA84|nr:MarR family transcriptional regulator [Rhizobium sp. RU33A]SIR05679.1 DNA-binding transcriptional regulator, MarR family [Rhizobium sp. RU33A]
MPFRLLRVAESVDHGFMQFCGPEDELSWSEWQVLWSLGERTPTTAKAISSHSGLSKTKISRAVKVLEDKGYLIRKKDRSDRRFELLSLTHKGQHRFERLADEAGAFQQWLERSVNIAYLSSLDSGLIGLEDLISTGHLRAPQRQAEEPLA